MTALTNEKLKRILTLAGIEATRDAEYFLSEAQAVWDAAQAEQKEVDAKLCESYQDWAANWALHENELAAIHGAKDCADAIRRQK